MNTQFYEARYAPYVARILDRCFRDIDTDRELRKYGGGYKAIDDAMLDLNAEGQRYLVSGAPIEMVVELAVLEGEELLRRNRT